MLEDRRFVDNGQLITSAGIAAGIDMSLANVAATSVLLTLTGWLFGALALLILVSGNERLAMRVGITHNSGA